MCTRAFAFVRSCVRACVQEFVHVHVCVCVLQVEPSADDLADIALASAQSAAAFG